LPSILKMNKRIKIINQNLFIMKKTLFIFAVMLLSIAVSAQTMGTRSIEQSVSPNFKSHHMATPSSNSSRIVIYSEGFEDTQFGALPTGWTCYFNNPNIFSCPWVSIANDEDLVGIENPAPIQANTGIRSMAKSWRFTGNLWAFSAGFSLSAGETYTVQFWFRAPGYPQWDEYDKFEVRIGQTATHTAMATANVVFTNTDRINEWTLASGTFTPTANGTYYLGFHDLNAETNENGGYGLYIAIDDIEITGGVICDPIKNLTVNYQSDCTTASLTWTAPGAGSFEYEVLRDGNVIETVTTESYIDNSFEPSLTHLWAVRVLCQGGHSSEVNVSKEPCIETNCSPAKYLSVSYSDNCDAAVLTWTAPPILLWDNTDDRSDYGGVSIRCIFDAAPHWVIADDFNVPAGETWTISEVYFSGFHNTSSGYFQPPHYFGIEIYNDNGNNRPGNRILEELELMPQNGTVSAAYPLLALSTPFEISTPGKYWISIYAVYLAEMNLEDYRYLVHYSEVPKGADLCRWDEKQGTEWVPEDGYPSMYFRIHGSKTEGEIYNVYRDNILIAEKIAANTYTDDSFDPKLPYKWSVKVACPASVGGGESTPSYATTVACNPDASIVEKTNNSFTISPNPATSGSIKITAENNFHALEVVNFLGQVVIFQTNINNSQATLDVSNLNNGIYFVRITSNNGASVMKFIKQ